MKTFSKIALLTGVCIFWISCASKPQPGFVYRDWSLRMSEMGIFPVFPPREDVAVGDVYLLPTHPYDASVIEVLGGAGNAGFHKQNLFADGIWKGTGTNQTVNLLQFLTNYYASRPVLPPTTTNLAATFDLEPKEIGVTPVAGPPPNLANRTNVFDTVALTRLKQVAFPDFAVTTVDQVSASAMVPIEAIRASFGFSSSDVGRISFKVPQAESYGLPSDYLLHDFFTNDLSADTTGSIYLLCKTKSEGGFLAEGAPRLARAQFDDSAFFLEQRLKGQKRLTFKKALERAKKHIYLAVISEVFYARSMDINVEFTKTRQTSASARPMGIEEVASLARFLKGTNASTPGAASSSSGGQTNTTEVAGETSAPLSLGTNMNVFDLVAQMRTNNVEMSGNVPGGQVKVVSVSQSSVGVRRVFEQPVAVGVRGMLLRIELNAQDFTDRYGAKKRGFKIATEAE